MRNSTHFKCAHGIENESCSSCLSIACDLEVHLSIASDLEVDLICNAARCCSNELATLTSHNHDWNRCALTNNYDSDSKWAGSTGYSKVMKNCATSFTSEYIQAHVFSYCDSGHSVRYCGLRRLNTVV